MYRVGVMFVCVCLSVCVCHQNAHAQGLCESSKVNLFLWSVRRNIHSYRQATVTYKCKRWHSTYKSKTTADEFIRTKTKQECRNVCVSKESKEL